MLSSKSIKHELNLSDGETVLQIRVESYLQYFVGLSSYSKKTPFVEIFKQMGGADFSYFEQAILNSVDDKKKR